MKRACTLEWSVGGTEMTAEWEENRNNFKAGMSKAKHVSSTFINLAKFAATTFTGPSQVYDFWRAVLAL